MRFGVRRSLSNWVKVGTNAVLLWLSVGIALGAVVGGSGSSRARPRSTGDCGCTTFGTALGIGGRIANLRNPDGSGARIQVPKDQVRRYTSRSYEIVSRRFQESVVLAFFLAVGGTVTAAFFLRQSGRSATEDQHIRGATLAPIETVVALVRASRLPFDFTLAGVPLFREAETDHVLVCGAPGSGKGVAIKELLDQIRARGDRAILYDPSGECVQAYYRHGKDVLLNPLDARSPAWTPGARGRQDGAPRAVFAPVCRTADRDYSTRIPRLGPILEIGVTSRESSAASGTTTTEYECTHHLVVNRRRWQAVGHPRRARNSTTSRGYRIVRGNIRRPWLRNRRIRQGQVTLKPSPRRVHRLPPRRLDQPSAAHCY